MRVYRRGKRGTWWVDFTAQDGRRFVRSTGTTDEAAAKEWAATAYRDQWRQHRLGEAPSHTWDEAVLSWLDEHQHLRSLEEAKRNLRWLSARLIGKPLAGITADMVRKISSERQAEPANAADIEAAKAAGERPPAPRMLSPATVNRYLSDLSRILKHAQLRGWLPAPPPVPKLHEPEGRTNWITHEQALALLAELPDHLRAMARFALATGLRESNVRLLQWSEVDLPRAAAWVHADEAKAGKALSVPLNPDAMDVLRGQQGMHKRWVFPAPRWTKKRRPEDKPRLTWEMPTGKASSAAWRKACIRAGLPTLRWHDLRHTWASWHRMAGTPDSALQELGGWASADMLQRYAHLAPSHVAAWAGNIGPATTARQVPSEPAKKKAPEVADSHRVGWLMGLEPTTTRITTRSRGAHVLKINDLRKSKDRKVG
jgi:integrase